MKIQCRLIRTVLWTCLLVQLAFFILAWGSIHPSIGPIGVRLAAKGLEFDALLALSPDRRLIGVALGLPALLAMSYGLWRLDRMLLNVERGAMFAAATIAHLRAFAGATLMATLLSMLETPLRPILFRLLLGGSERGASMGVNSEELMLMLLCGLFYLITRMMHEGRRLTEENEGFV
jgi:hypothetical protein